MPVSFHLLAFAAACISQNPGTEFENCKPIESGNYPTAEACYVRAHELQIGRTVRVVCIKEGSAQ